MFVFLTTVDAQDGVTFTAVTDFGYGIDAVVPAGWKNVSRGIYARSESAADPTLVAVQAAPATAAEVWTSLLPQLGLSAAAPPVGTRRTSALDWDLYQVIVPGSGSVVVDVGLAELGGTTLVVLMQSAPTEAATLHDDVFLPILDSVMPLAASPASSAGPPPYRVEEVSFAGGAPDVSLAGTLTVPPTDGPHPAVVLLSGSGPQDRDESLAPLAAIKPFALIADALTRAGVAVLRFDDRGTARSTGDYASATVQDFTLDGAAAISYLLTRPDVDPTHVGVLGHSEGGIEAAALGAHDPRIAFIIGMAAPAVDGIELITAQYIAIRRSDGMSEALLAAGEPHVRQMFRAARDGDITTAEEAWRTIVGLAYDDQPVSVQRQLGPRQAYIDAQVPAQVGSLRAMTPEQRSILSSDAGADWAMVDVPVLGLFGGKDEQVVASQNAPALVTAVAKAGRTHNLVVTLPNANHLFQEAESGSVAEYGTLPQTFTPDFLPTIVDWVSAHVADASATS